MIFETLLETVASAHNAGRHRALLESVWEQERWFDTPHQRQAAERVEKALLSAGLMEAGVVPYEADGETRWQDWITRMAWRCPAAQLRMGAEVLADRKTTPQCVVMWSGPMDETTAGVVDGDAMETVDPARVAGKFVLTAEPPQQMKQKLLGTDALAVVSDYLGPTHGADEETVKWCNTWSDRPGGWYVHADDTPMPGFNLSPRMGRKLRDALAADANVQLSGFCQSELFAGEGQNVTAVLPGRQPDREIWIYGHAAEQGAHDNASGVSVLVEAITMLAELVREGRLPQPDCGIRVITTEECLGMVAFATKHETLRDRAMAGLNIDGVGDATSPERPFSLYWGGLASPTIGWPLAGAIGRRVMGMEEGYHLGNEFEPPTADHMIADPNCGIPGAWIGMGKNSTGYHSSFDTPAVCSDISLRSNAILTATWAYAMAAMSNELVESALPEMVQWLEANVVGGEAGSDAARLRSWAAAACLRDAERFGVEASVFERAAEKYVPAGSAPLEDLPDSGTVYERTAWGTCTFETLPPERSKGLSCWSGWQCAALCWTNGERSVDAVERLARAEGGCPEGGVERLMEACVEAGLARKC